jgi:hypothetical protein
MKKGMKDVRGARKAERRYGDEAKRCTVCGRWHTRRDKTCSEACAQKARILAANRREGVGGAGGKI